MSSSLEVSEREGGSAVIFPLEDDGTLSSSTLKKCFPESCGLRFRSSVSRKVRGLRCVEGKFYPPEGGWENCVHFCSSFTKYSKRKAIDSATEDVKVHKVKRLDEKSIDLIVLGLTKDTTEEHIRECFEKFGELQLVSIKRYQGGMSKGFGFIRFLTFESQKTVLENDSHPYLVNGRRCEVKIPLSKIKNKIEQKETEHKNKIERQETEFKQSKIFVGNCSADIIPLDLRQYFSQFGEVAHVYVPPTQVKPYAFVTFKSHTFDRRLWGQHHIIKGNAVNVSPAAERIDIEKQTLKGTKQNEQTSKGTKQNEQTSSSIQKAHLDKEIMLQLQQMLGSQKPEDINRFCQSISLNCFNTLMTPKKHTLKSLLETQQSIQQLLPFLLQGAAKVAQDLNMSLVNNQVLQVPSGLNRGTSVPVDVRNVQKPPMPTDQRLIDQNAEFCKTFNVGASSDAKAKMQRGDALSLESACANGDFTSWRPFYNSVGE